MQPAILARCLCLRESHGQRERERERASERERERERERLRETEIERQRQRQRLRLRQGQGERETEREQRYIEKWNRSAQPFLPLLRVASDPTSRVPCCAPCPTEPPAATRVSWIPPATTPRLVLQFQWARGRGGDCAIIGPDGSDEPPVDRHRVRTI